jgi:hypothetical protein
LPVQVPCALGVHAPLKFKLTHQRRKPRTPIWKHK